MKPSEAAILLATAAAVDRRTVGESDARVWADLLGDIDPQDAIQAIKNHYALSRDMIYPADIIAGVKAIERTRIAEGPNVHTLEPPEWVDPDDEVQYRRWLRESAERIRRGIPVEHGPEPVAVPSTRIKALVEGLAEGKRA